jgi:hypothetical protein
MDDLKAHAADVKGPHRPLQCGVHDYGATVVPRSTGRLRRPSSGPLPRWCGPWDPRASGRRTRARRTIRTACRRFQRPPFRRKTRIALCGCRPAAFKVRVKLTMEAHFDPDAQSYNVVWRPARNAELPGRNRPSRRAFRFLGSGRGRHRRWRRLRGDLGGAAADESAQPCGRAARSAWCCSPTRKTVRAEATGYRDARTRPDLSKHVLLMESDGGVFDPVGPSASPGPIPARATVSAHRVAAGADRRQSHWRGRLKARISVRPERPAGFRRCHTK